MLTEQQVNHFETFGMLLLRQLFSSAEMEEITAEAEAASAGQAARGRPHLLTDPAAAGSRLCVGWIRGE